MNVTCCDAFALLSVVSRAFSALYMYSKFRHHPHDFCYKDVTVTCKHIKYGDVAVEVVP